MYTSGSAQGCISIHRTAAPAQGGSIEAAIGVMLVIEPHGRSIFFYLVVGIWALVGGFILISDAVRLRRAHLSEVEHEKEQVT
jgi:uncharacterized membrane protein HdeD (DUF308 family)